MSDWLLNSRKQYCKPYVNREGKKCITTKCVYFGYVHHCKCVIRCMNIKCKHRGLYLFIDHICVEYNNHEIKLDKNLQEIVYTYLNLNEIAIKFHSDKKRLGYLINKYYYAEFNDTTYLIAHEFYYALGHKLSNGYIPGIEDLESLCEKGNIRFVKHFISLGLKFNNICLENAVTNNHLRLVKYFLDLNTLNLQTVDYLMELTAEKGYIEMYKLLIKYGLEINNDDLIACCQNGHLELAEYIISEGIKPEDYLISYACANGHLDILKYLLSLGVKIPDDSMYQACVCGHTNIVYTLLKLGIIPSSQSLTDAISNEHTNVIILLLSADAEIEDIHVSIALGHGNINILRLFKNLGYNFRNPKCLALRRISKDSTLECVKFLIDNGIYTNRNLLNYMIKISKHNGNLDIAQYLKTLNII